MERFVEVPGGRLLVADDGAGPPIVLVHAGIADHRAWDAMVQPLVAAGYRAIRYDARGFGKSATEDVEFSNRADLVAVLDAAGVERAALVGNSRGGQIAIDTAVEFPDRVVALVPVGAGLGGYDAPATPEELALYEEGERLQAAGEVDAALSLDVRLWVDGPGQPEGRAPGSVREAVRAMDRPLLEPGRVFGRPIVLRPPANDRLAGLRCPLLAVVGALDTSDTAATAHRLAEGCPSARAVVVPGAHMVGMEVPDALAGMIADFLGPLRPWS
jgi:3-oxoadipate enol-lactonase